MLNREELEGVCSELTRSRVSLLRIGWEQQQLLKNVVAESSWERWSGLVDGATVEELLSGGEFKLRAERFAGPRISFGSADGNRRHSALEWMEIDPQLLSRKLASLSNGEMRRVLLARAWMERPEVLLLDDLWGGLDQKSRLKMEAMLRALSKEGSRILLLEEDGDQGDQKSADEQEGPESDFRSKSPSLLNRPNSSSNLAAAYRPEVRCTATGEDSPAVGQPLAQLIDIRLSYGESEILNHFHWTIRAGDRTLLVGPNGSGKSSLLAMLRADHPQIFRNNITLFGEKPGKGLDVWSIRHRVVLLSPELQIYLSPRLTVEEVVLGGVQQLWDYTRPSLWSEQLRTQEALDALEISSWSARKWNSLTPSAQRRVLLARAWASSPEMLLLDETFHGLSSADEEAMRKALLQMAPRLPALVWVTHDPSTAPEWLNRAVHL